MELFGKVMFWRSRVGCGCGMVRIGSVVVSYAGALFWNCGVKCKWGLAKRSEVPVKRGVVRRGFGTVEYRDVPAALRQVWLFLVRVK